MWSRVSDVLPSHMPYLIYNHMSGASDVLPIVKFSGHLLNLHDPLDPYEPCFLVGDVLRVSGSLD